MRRGHVVFFRILLQEVLDEQRNIFAALAQRRQVKRDHVQTVEQILAERAFAHHLPQIDVGRGDDAHVDVHLLHAAEMHELAILQHAQYLGLRVHGHCADFVEEKRAAIGNFKQSFLGRDRAGECALHVAKES